MVTNKRYVWQNDQGNWRIGACDVSLDSIILAFQDGLSAETIQQLYPALSLEEVYGAVAFYLANEQEIDQYLLAQQACWQNSRQAAAKRNSAVAARLRAVAKNQLRVQA